MQCSYLGKNQGTVIVHVFIYYDLDLSKGIARPENFFVGLKKNRVRTNGGRTLVAYSSLSQ